MSLSPNNRTVLGAISFLTFFGCFFAEAQNGSITMVISQTKDYTISVEYNSKGKQHCESPLVYSIKKTGKLGRNQLFKWNIEYVPCDKEILSTQTVTFEVPKGDKTVEKTFSLKTKNLVSILRNNSLVVKTIDDPEFDIAGPSAVQEGDEVSLRVRSSTVQEGTRWVWAKGSLANVISSGATIKERLSSTTHYYVYAVMGSFRSAPKEFTVTVTKLPEPPTDFYVEGKAEITDIESTLLTIKSNSNLEGVKWVWEQNNQKVGEGLSIQVSPNKTTIYNVHSEYYWKKSPTKSFQLKVINLPEPPNYEIGGPTHINEGDRVWLRAEPNGNGAEVKWIWTSSKELGEKIADSILVSPLETTTYTLTADLNGKKSKVKTKEIEVIQKAIAPVVVGQFKKCISSEPVRFTLKNGRLGTGSKYWNWYEGKRGSGKLIQAGNEISLNPLKTTSYYVQPNNNAQGCTEFIIEVGSEPILPKALVAAESVCADLPFIISTKGEKDLQTRWLWYAQDYKNRKNYKGDGLQLLDSINTSTTYSIRAENEYCQSTQELVLTIAVKDHSTNPMDVVAIPVKGKQYKLKIVGAKLADGSQWIWYKKSCGTNAIGYGEELSYRAKKRNHIYVRAQGSCEDQICKELEFNYQKNRSRYIFVNVGLSTSTIYDDILKYNSTITVGSNRIYIRGKVPLSLVANSSDPNPSYAGIDLITDDKRVLNYPANSNTYYQFSGSVDNKVYSVSGGFFLGGNILKLYIGGGYAQSETYWGINIFSYDSNMQIGSDHAKHVNLSMSGPVVEAGVFFKLQGFNIMAGTSMIVGHRSMTYSEYDFGIGVNFNKKINSNKHR